jgi:hypothetical protein
VSLVEKIVHWFSPPEDTCAKGPSPAESATERQKWREEIHGNREEVQHMQALAYQTRKVFESVNKEARRVGDVAREGARVAEEAIRLLEEARKREVKK